MTPIKRTRTPKSEKTESVLPPTAEIPQNTNQYDSILQMVEELQKKNLELEKKVSQANGDISEEVKDSKRKYGFELDGYTRRKDELFEYGFSVLIDERQEKAVISTETIGRPVSNTNYNTGKKTYTHDVKITFHDGSHIEMDVLDYINQKYVIKQLVDDSDIEVKDGKKHYTFRTEKFGTFTVAQSFIN